MAHCTWKRTRWLHRVNNGLTLASVHRLKGSYRAGPGPQWTHATIDPDLREGDPDRNALRGAYCGKLKVSAPEP